MSGFTLANYQVLIASPVDGTTLAVLDASAFNEIKYQRVLNGIAECSLTLPSTSPYADFLAPVDTFIEIYRTNPLKPTTLIKEETFFQRSYDRLRQQNDDLLVVGGKSLNYLLDGRVIDPDDDPLSAGGYSTQAGKADDVLLYYANYNIGPLASTPRQIQGLTLAPSQQAGLPVGARLRHDSLLKTFQDLGFRGGVDFIIERTFLNNLLLTILPMGRDLRMSTNYPFAPFVLADPDRGNLTDPNFTLDNKATGNFIYSTGQGQPPNQIVVKMAGDSVNDSPYARREFVNSANNIDKTDPLGQLTSAQIELRNRRPIKSFTFTPLSTQPGTTYRVDLDVADYITAKWGNVTENLRVSQVDIDVTSGGEQIAITVQLMV